MRTAVFIVGLTAIALTLVAYRQQEVRTQHEIQRLSVQLLRQRRALWDLDVKLGRLSAVEAVAARAEEMELALVGPDGGSSVRPTEILADAGTFIVVDSVGVDLRRPSRRDR